MPFSFTGLSLKIKDNPFGFEDCNIIRNDALYNKQQTEVLVAQDGTAIKPDVVPESALVISNSPFDTAKLHYRTSGAMTWGNQFDDELWWLYREEYI